jgi:ABC-type multidrug transport system fused ATPase/permease subunit
LISIFFFNATAAIVTSQAILVILTVFCGVFISWNDMPGYWLWMQESAAITQSTRAAYVSVSDYLTYDCHTATTDGFCIGPTGELFKCIENTLDNAFCQVDGREVVRVTQGVGVDESAWTYFGILVAIYAALRVSLLFFMYFHPHEVLSKIKLGLFGVVGRTVMDSQVAIRKLKLQIAYLLAKESSSLNPLQDQSSSDALKMSVVQGVNSADVLHHTPASHPEAKHATLTFRNVSVILPNGTKLLDNVSAVCRPGRVMALMGPSGAGMLICVLVSRFLS